MGRPVGFVLEAAVEGLGLSLWGLSVEMVTAAMKIKDTCYLEEKLYFNLVLPLYVLASNVHSYQN